MVSGILSENINLEFKGNLIRSHRNALKELNNGFRKSQQRD